MKNKFYIKNLFSIFFIVLDTLIFRKPRSLTVLCYHSISNDNTIVDVSIKSFKKQIQHLKNNYEFVSGEQAENYLNGKIRLNKPSALLTFDDGYKDVLINLCPYLHKYKIPAIFFVISNPEFVNREEIQNNKKLLTTKDIKKIHKMGFEIGSHTKTHCNLSKITDQELIEEISSSKIKLERNLNTKIKYFAYPKGIYSEKAIKVCKKAGYKLAFTTEFGVAKYSTDKLLIPRISVDSTYNFLGFKAILTRTIIPYFKIKKMIMSKLIKFTQKINQEPKIKSDMLKQASVLNLFLCALEKTFSNNKKNEKVQCLRYVGPYKFISQIKKRNNFTNYGIGIYKDNKGKKVFIKTWKGKTKNFPYYSLVNEYNMAKVLSNVISKSKKSKFKVPKPIGYLKTQNYLSIIFEYVDGKTLSRFSVKKQADVLSKAINFLNALSPLIIENYGEYIKKRGWIFYLASLPAIFLYAFTLERENKKTILYSFLKAYLYSLSVLKKKLTLAHGDLFPDNIFVSKSQYYILDCEHMRYTLSEYDLNHLSIIKKDTNLLRQILRNHKSFAQNNFLSLYIAIQSSIFTDPNTKRRHYFNFLKNNL